MAVIKTLLGVVILLAIVVFGYWLYATYTIASANNEIWVAINSKVMPDPLRKWSCTEVSTRLGETAAEAPEGCGDAWVSAAPLTESPVGAPATGTTDQ